MDEPQQTDIFSEVKPAAVPDEYMATYDGLAKEWLSTSAIALGMLCEIAFEFRYIDHLPGTVGVRLASGSAAHKAREVNLSQKINTFEDIGVKEVTDAARDHVNKRFDENEVQVENEFEGKSKKQAQGIAVDLSVEMAAKDREVFHPEIQPAAVEESMAIQYPGMRRTIVGKLDVRQIDDRIRDLKTGKRAYGQTKADVAMGITTYGMLKRAETGVAPPGYMIDNVVCTGKTKAKHNPYFTTRTEEQLQIHLRRFAAWHKVMDRGIFAPCNPESWFCSRDWCSYWNRCPFANR